ncbi:hypothetical protein [Vulcaniibacterium tengchongense]|uniref:Secreted protein n=1 Tax=Vulcaniibacterium tengchongense TaxID=1273429 RepID=A0A3N4V7R1_9GAMM|nr:hypothetical protein [Vulcaniibacterium tengchongense]RPE75741.1 hypothetical protein EDC50_2635 [Vulcaniibacterium tengchongense]
MAISRATGWSCVLASLAAFSAAAAEPRPEIARGPAQPQPVGAVHTVRQIPEACARLQGMFTGQAAAPYRFEAVRIDPACRPRARFVDAAQAQPSAARGWVLNDLIRVPNAACPSQQAVVRVWRKPGAAAPTRDGQGQTRLYLEQQRQAAAAGQLASLPQFAAQLQLEGEGCP